MIQVSDFCLGMLRANIIDIRCILVVNRMRLRKYVFNLIVSLYSTINVLVHSAVEYELQKKTVEFSRQTDELEATNRDLRKQVHVQCMYVSMSYLHMYINTL